MCLLLCEPIYIFALLILKPTTMKKLLFLSAFALFALVGCKCNTQKCAAESECTEAVATACSHDEAACDMEKPCCKAGEECKCLANNEPCECKCAEGKCCCENCDPANCAKAGKKACVKDGEACNKECKKECTKKEGACEETCKK